MAGKASDDIVRCSFCNKPQSQVRKLIAGPNGAYICDECIEVCSEIIEEEFGLNRLVKFEEIMQKGYAKEVVQYLYWARERYEFAVNYIDSISVKYLTDEKDFASMLEEL